jgi:hypothetical protein
VKQGELFGDSANSTAMDFEQVLGFLCSLAGHTCPAHFSEAFIQHELCAEVHALKQVRGDDKVPRYILVNEQALKAWVVEQAMGAHPAWPLHALPERTWRPAVFWDGFRRPGKGGS